MTTTSGNAADFPSGFSDGKSTAEYSTCKNFNKSHANTVQKLTCDVYFLICSMSISDADFPCRVQWGSQNLQQNPIVADVIR